MKLVVAERLPEPWSRPSSTRCTPRPLGHETHDSARFYVPSKPYNFEIIPSKAVPTECVQVFGVILWIVFLTSVFEVLPGGMRKTWLPSGGK